MGTRNEYLDIRMKLGVHETWCADNVKRAAKKVEHFGRRRSRVKTVLLAAVADERKILGMHPDATFALPAQN
jgi:hypothetical protein